MDSIGNNISDFELLKELGRGQFGVVKKMKSKINGQIYAIKVINQPKNKEEQKSVIREEFIMDALSHPNIIKLYKTFKDVDYIYFVSEYIDGINLEKYVINFRKNNPNSHIDQNFVLDIFKQILIGLTFLHDKEILHRDIKPDNIILDRNNNIKIADFGLSAFYKKGYGELTYNNTQVGRPDYVCPEILHNEDYDHRCDIFSLGYTIYYIMNFHLPSKTTEKLQRIDSSGAEDNFYDERLKKLVRKMFNYKQEDRPTAMMVLNELESIRNSINNIEVSNPEYFSIQNNPNLNKKNNNQLNDKNDKPIISSMKCILQFLYRVDNMSFFKNVVVNNLKNNINTSNFFPLLFFNILDVIGKKNNNSINNQDYNNKIANFIKQLRNKGFVIDGVRPIVLFYNILYHFKNEFSSVINWNNKLENCNYKMAINLPLYKFSDFYYQLSEFYQKYKCPLVDIFYFIIINLKICPICKNIFKADCQFASMLMLLNNNPSSKINDLIRAFFSQKLLNDFITCNCGYKGNLFEELALFNSPDYLMLDLDEGGRVEFEQIIDLSQYIKTDLGPRKYYLYGVINKEKSFNQETNFICSIKETNLWTFFAGDSKEIAGIESIEVGIPSCAIYKKIIEK